jgi:hypothetical protein
MNSKLFFLILSANMIVFTIISICTGPNINSHLFSGTENCKILSDGYEKNKGGYNDNQKKAEKLRINVCKRENAMHDLEYTSLIFDVIVGTLCCILGLLHYLDVGQNFEKITGIIGLASGIIGFILTIVYVGYSAYIFNNHHSDVTLLYENGAEFKWDGTKFVQPWTTEDLTKDYNANKVKYKDLGKKLYNYDSKLYKIHLENGDHDSKNCYYLIDSDDGVDTIFFPINAYFNCKYLWKSDFLSQSSADNSNKYLYDKWLTSIIFSSLTFASAIGVAIFGLLIFLNKGDSSHTRTIPFERDSSKCKI